MGICDLKANKQLKIRTNYSMLVQEGAKCCEDSRQWLEVT